MIAGAMQITDWFQLLAMRLARVGVRGVVLP